MKHLTLLTILALSFSAPTLAASTKKTTSFDSLGSNQGIIERAKAYDSGQKVQIVQKRLVDRNWRFEVTGDYGYNAGGDPYLEIRNLGFGVNMHINAHWSVGYRYFQPDNGSGLSSEGKRIYTEAYQNALAEGPNATYRAPNLATPEMTNMAVINWYPLYGKLNLFNMGVAQFDVYFLGGYGQTKLNYSTLNAAVPSQRTTESVETITGGGGIGVWWNNYITSRFEVRYETYTDQIRPNRKLDLTVLTASLGLFVW